MISDDHPKMREVSIGPFRGMVIINSMIDQFLQDGGNPDNLMRDRAELLKSTGSTRSALVELNNSEVDGKIERMYVKEFHFKGTIHSLKPLIRQHRAQVMWKISWHLLNHSIPVPEPEGYLIKRRGPFCLKGYFFSRVLPKCSTLDELTQDLDQFSKRFDSGGLIGVLAQNVAKMHNSGASHSDLKWSNILVHREQNELWFVDLDGAKLHRRMPSSKAVTRDLGRFMLSGLEAGIDEATMDKFLDAYAFHRKVTRKSFDKPTRRILEKLKGRHEKKRLRDNR